ncbi:MAG TPA: TIGR02266 family protein, partial [Myxococcaceae bacterium]|nr:TIGR02266 family protein [Myxococcaceae bacterium]
MAETNPGAIGLAVKLPFATPEEFVSKYGNNVTRGGISMRSKAVKPPGTLITLELRLASGARLIYASAVVHFVTGQAGQGVSGMGVRFLTLDADSQRFIDTQITPLPHAKADLPPVPNGVGPADYGPGAPGAAAQGVSPAHGLAAAASAPLPPPGTEPAAGAAVP